MDLSQLDKLKAVLGEQYNNYLIVVEKDGVTAHAYSSKTSAFGMAELVKEGIKFDWQIDCEDQLEEEEEDNNG